MDRRACGIDGIGCEVRAAVKKKYESNGFREEHGLWAEDKIAEGGCDGGLKGVSTGCIFHDASVRRLVDMLMLQRAAVRRAKEKFHVPLK